MGCVPVSLAPPSSSQLLDSLLSPSPLVPGPSGLPHMWLGSLRSSKTLEPPLVGCMDRICKSMVVWGGWCVCGGGVVLCVGVWCLGG